MDTSKNQQRMNDAVARAKREWETALDAIRDPIFIHDRDFKIIRANMAYARAAGMDIKDVIGHPYWEIFPRHDGPLPACRKLNEGGDEVRVEEVILDSGETYLSRGYCILDETGDYLCSIHVLEDITEKKLAQERLAESEGRLKEAQSVAHLGSWELDLVKNELWWSDENYRIFGIEPNTQNSYETFLATVHPDDRDYVNKAYTESVQNRTRYDIEHRLLLPDGRVKWVNERCKTHYADDGTPLRSSGTTLEITERKHAENHAARFDRMLDSSTNEIYVFDADTLRFVEVNEGARRNLGYSMDELKQLTPLDLKHHFTREQFNELLEPLLNGKQQVSVFETFHQRKDGSKYPVEVHLQLFASETPPLFLAIINDITRRRFAEQALNRSNRALRTLSSCNAVLIHARDEHKLLENMCRIITETGGYRFAWIGFAEHDDAKSVCPVVYAGHEQGYLDSARISYGDNEFGQGPVGRSIRSGEAVVIRDVMADPCFAPWCQAAVARGYASLVVLPLRSCGQVFGNLSIYASERDAFDEEETRLLTELADDLAFGIQSLRTRAERDRLQSTNLEVMQRHKRALTDAIRAISRTVEKRDPYTAGHQQRVADLAVAIGGELGLDEERLEGLGLGATIHDLGKIYVPAEILNRPGRLSDAEFEMIKSHSQVGYDIIKDVEFPWPVGQMVLQHHERLDGSGYPQGLKGDEITLEARILAVADVVEAITAHRPYRAARGLETALTEIETNRDRLYDPKVADACLRLIREGRFSFDNETTGDTL